MELKLFKSLHENFWKDALGTFEFKCSTITENRKKLCSALNQDTLADFDNLQDRP